MASTKSRARNLDDSAIEKIVQILDGWTGKLSWELFIVQIEKVTHNLYTRQALDKHARIKDAFTARKVALGGRDRKQFENKSPEMQLALQRIARLEAENQRLSNENNTLLNQFVRWAYNAHGRGLDQAFLDTPLPSVNRERSDKPQLVKSSSRSGKNAA
jgi:hypothetical protein